MKKAIAGVLTLIASSAHGISNEQAREMGYEGSHGNGIPETVQMLKNSEITLETGKKWVMNYAGLEGCGVLSVRKNDAGKSRIIVDCQNNAIFALENDPKYEVDFLGLEHGNPLQNGAFVFTGKEMFETNSGQLIRLLTIRRIGDHSDY